MLASAAVSILSVLFLRTGARFSVPKRQIWDISKDPTGGVILVGIPLWGPEVDFEYRVGSKNFREQDGLQSVLLQHQKELDALRKVIEHAPAGRDAGSAV